MFEGPDRVMPQHAWACISHDFFYSLFHFRTVAVNRTLTAGFLLFPERAMCQPLMCVVQQFFAVLAKRGVPFFVPAVKPDHLFYGLFLFFST